MRHALCAAVLLAGLAGLAGGCYQSHSYSPVTTPEYQQRPRIDASVFAEDTKLISNEAIGAVLDSKVHLPVRSNLAVLRLDYSGAYGEAHNAAYLQAIAESLGNGSPAGHVTEVPAILLAGRKLTISRLREAAARLQCELVLVYYVSASQRYTNRFLGKDSTKIYSSVHAMLLHTRTGVVPMTTVIDQEHGAIESRKDRSDWQLRERAQHEATIKALNTLGREISTFMSAAVSRQAGRTD